jgi:type I restriction enzyme S subunit
MKKYENYKSSGIEWIGNIPENWTIKPVKLCLNFSTGFTPSTGNSEYFDGENPWVNISDLKDKYVIASEKNISDEAIIKYNATIIPQGSLLFSFKLSIGRVAFAGRDLYTNEAIFSVFPSSDINLDFFYYSLPLQVVENSILNIYGAKMLNQELIKNAKILIPTKEEQTAIANFLDTKTTEIDQSITDKENLINLLEEGKKALINEAVTKGIDKNLALKSSGIDWLGDIPEHWEVKKLKYLLQGVKGALKAGPFGSDLKTSDYQSEGNYKVYTQRHVLDNDFETGEDYISNDKFSALSVFEVKPFDILVTTRGSIGKATVVPQNIQTGIIHPCLIRLRIDNKRVITNWLLIYFNDSSYFKENVHLESNSTIIEVIYGYTLNNISIPIPPIEEQTKIVTYIETETQKIDEKVSLIQQEIALLKEYRGALIFEAVTGKIDVS